jgi:hypothetical protein
MLVSTLRFSATTSCSLPAREQSIIFSTNCEQQQQQQCKRAAIAN